MDSEEKKADGERGRARSAIVTGGAKGIGRAVSDRLAASGWDLLICGRDGAALTEAAEQIQKRHRVTVRTVSVDLSEPGAVETVFAPFGHPEELPLAMVLGAADYGVLGTLDTIDFTAWRRSFDLNFFSVAEILHRYLCVSLKGPASPRRRIAVMGGAGLGGAQVSGAISAYSCAKAALNRLVEVVHEESNARGIDINCVLPGLVNTGMVDTAIVAGPMLGAIYDASLKTKSGGGTPPETAAEFIAWLLSDECSGVSGRLFSARWDRSALASPAAVSADPDLFRLRRIDNELFGKRK
jgi:NAD(P)-dependent dehydrogenase (short-subunit alcohol dehydrogenase family)